MIVFGYDSQGITMKALIKIFLPALVIFSLIVGIGSCSRPTEAPNGTTRSAMPLQVDGSSTVYPITQAVAQAFSAQRPQMPAIAVEFSGTTGGFRKFCTGQTVINDASRPITQQEMEACRQADIRYLELPVAFDAITLVVNPQNDWADDITLDELKAAWEPSAQRKVTTWNQLRPSWPNRPLKLYGPGADSGTYDYFTEVVLGGTASRSDYTASEDDELLVQGVNADNDALGYFGFAYYEDNVDQLKALAVDSGSGPMLPSKETVERGQYQPFSRPLFIYVNAQAMQQNDDLREFVDFYLENAAPFVDQVGYVPLPQDGYEVAQTHVYRNKVGTAFDGVPQPGLTIGEVLRKQKNF